MRAILSPGFVVMLLAACTNAAAGALLIRLTSPAFANDQPNPAKCSSQ